jgi:hypothetical protein
MPKLNKKGRISISLFFGTTPIMSSLSFFIHPIKIFIAFPIAEGTYDASADSFSSIVTPS